MQEVEVKALPQNLPHEIKVDISVLKTFEDKILVKDLAVPPKVTVLKNADEIVAQVLPPQKVEAIETAQETVLKEALELIKQEKMTLVPLKEE